VSTVELTCPICESGFDSHDLYAAHLATAHLPGAPATAPAAAPAAPVPPGGESTQRPYLANIGNFTEYDEFEAVQNEVFFRDLDGEPPLEGARGLVVPDLSTTVVGEPALSAPSLLDPPGPPRIDPNRIYDPERHESVSLQVVATVLVLALLCGVIYLLQSA
jgi:hypothetical protein